MLEMALILPRHACSELVCGTGRQGGMPPLGDESYLGTTWGSTNYWVLGSDLPIGIDLLDA